YSPPTQRSVAGTCRSVTPDQRRSVPDSPKPAEPNSRQSANRPNVAELINSCPVPHMKGGKIEKRVLTQTRLKRPRAEGDLASTLDSGSVTMDQLENAVFSKLEGRVLELFKQLESSVREKAGGPPPQLSESSKILEAIKAVNTTVQANSTTLSEVSTT